jgi:hypothetical protein
MFRYYIADLLNLLFGAGSFGKLWSACRRHKLQYTEWRMNRYRPMYNYIILTVHFYVHRIQKCIDNSKKKCIKINLQPRLGCRCFYHMFTKWISNVVYIALKNRSQICKISSAFFVVFPGAGLQMSLRATYTGSWATCCPRATGWGVLL